MQKIIARILSTFVISTVLMGCNSIATPPAENPPVEPPQQEAAWGHISDDEYDIINTHTVDGGEFVFKEKKYEFQGNNLVIADVKNETENNYTLVVHCTYFDEAGEQVFAEKSSSNYKKITGDDSWNYETISPIISEGDVIGSVCILSKDDNVTMSNVEKLLAASASCFLGKQMEQ